MIITLINIIIGIVYFLINLIIAPINNLLVGAIPPVNDALTAVGTLFDYITDCLGWAISVSGLSAWALALIVAYYMVKFTLPVAIYNIKLAIRWYDTLKK